MWREGYRPFFPLAAAIAVLALAAWGASLTGHGHMDVGTHAALMEWGVLGGAVLGFLLTAYPKQNGAAPPSRRLLIGLAAAHGVTHALLLLGLPGALPLGACVWAVATGWSARIAVPSLRRGWDGTTAAVPVALAAATVAWVLARTGARIGLVLGVHAFLVPLSLALLDRLLVFFSSRAVPAYDGVRRPGFAPLLFGAAAIRLVSEPVGDALFLAVITRQWTGWRPLAGARVPMVAVLHLGVLWILVGYAVDLAGLGLPPSIAMHLWLLGGLTTLLLGLSMRVVLGHGGQTIRLLPVGAVLLVTAQLAVLTRVAAPFLPGPATLLVAATLLGATFVLWLARFGRLAVAPQK